ncbi:Ctr copper transporter family protein [Ancylostoma duodenale]|uniref:Copper transport protein n=1 Tax=Ancylostoma duodenale TaxID=51022 RepID=A0A0C2DXU0_9BILA|nr:Ctr copper transporter family protein [Ancylostoma duodenale]
MDHNMTGMMDMQRRTNITSSQSPLADAAVDNTSQDSITFAPMLQVTGLTRRMFTGYRLVQASLYGIQALLAYVLMLIVMTFNGNLILSIVAGEAEHHSQIRIFKIVARSNPKSDQAA